MWSEQKRRQSPNCIQEASWGGGSAVLTETTMWIKKNVDKIINHLTLPHHSLLLVLKKKYSEQLD